MGVNKDKVASEVLIIDDDPTNLALLCDILTAYGYLARPAINGKLALQSIEAKLPDLILLDIVMPGIDGYEVCSILKSSEKSCEIPIIFISGRDDPLYKVKAFKEGAVDYISKPFNAEEVLARVGTHISLSKMQLEMKQRNLELQKSKSELERANKAKSDFLSNMSHEFRTPLTGIMGYTQILKLQENLTDTQKKYIDIIDNCSDHLLTLINQVLDVAKIEAKRMKLWISDFDLSEMIYSVFSIMQIKAEQKDIIFDCEELSPIPEMVVGDKKGLMQIMINLLGNAIKFTNRGKVIFRASYENESSIFRGEVEDTGVGIAKDKISVIFDAFIQVGDRETSVDGTGLGLNICQKLVELMGGKITVDSDLGKGSKFAFELKLPESENLVERIKTKEECIIGYKGERKSILIIDNSQAIQSLLMDVLKPVGFDVEVAKDEQAIIREINNVHPDLILIDFFLSGKDGLDVLDELNRDQNMEGTRIIGTSACSLEGDRIGKFAKSCHEFISKPIKIDHLFKIIKKQLQIQWVTEERTRTDDNKLLQIDKDRQEKTPAQDVLNIIYRKAELGDFFGLRRFLEKLLVEDEQLRNFCGKITLYADQFDDESIFNYIDNLTIKS